MPQTLRQRRDLRVLTGATSYQAHASLRDELTHDARPVTILLPAHEPFQPELHPKRVMEWMDGPAAMTVFFIVGAGTAVLAMAGKL